MRSMNRLLLAFAFVGICLPAGSAIAQNSASRAGQEIGRVLFGNGGGSDHAYADGALAGAIERERYESELLEIQQARSAEQLKQIRQFLAEKLVELKIPPEEARSIAMTYAPAPDDNAVVARARREGSKATFQAMQNAYQAYNYRLVDQLMIGLIMAMNDEAEASANALPPDPSGR
jgi:hypothetical protein